MILYIVRHGEPDYARDVLTERGWKQAEAVGKRLYKAGIDRIFASPMGRARETAAPLCRLTGMESTIENWTHEIGDERLTTFPDGVRKSISALQNTYFLENGSMDLGFENAYECPAIRETEMKRAVAEIQKHGHDFLERLGYRYENGVYRIIRKNDEKAALFCHAAFSRAWISTLLHIPLNIMWASFDYCFTGVTALEFANNENGITAPQCICYDDCGHLYADGLDGWM